MPLYFVPCEIFDVNHWNINERCNKNVFLPPTLKKFRGHITLGVSIRACTCVCASVCLFKTNKVRVLIFHKWIPNKKSN